jgi:hypothetical protein
MMENRANPSKYNWRNIWIRDNVVYILVKSNIQSFLKTSLLL